MKHMASSVLCSPPILHMSSSSHHYARLIDEACASRSATKLIEAAADFVQVYLQSELQWLHEHRKAASSPTSSPLPVATTSLHEALCRACRGGTVIDGTPSIGLGVLSAVWKHFVVPMFASSSQTLQNADERTVLARFLEFVLDLVVQDVLSHNWEIEKEIQLSKFFASYLLAVIKSYPSLVAENTIAAQIFHFYGVVAAAVGASLPDVSGEQLHRTILARLEIVIQAIGVSPHIPSRRKYEVLQDFMLHGSLNSASEGGLDGQSENPNLFRGVLANILVLFIKDIPEDDNSNNAEGLAYLMALLPADPSTNEDSDSPLLAMLNGTDIGKHCQILQRLCGGTGSSASSLTLFCSGHNVNCSGSAPSTTATTDASFSEKWLSATVPLLTAVASSTNARCAQQVTATLMHATAHPIAAEMMIALWSAVITSSTTTHLSNATLAASLVNVFVGGVCHYTAEDKSALAAATGGGSRLLRLCHVTGRIMQQCSRRSLSMGQFFQQLMLEALPMAAGGAVATWIITSLCEQLLDIHRRSIEEESPARNEETDAARFFHQPHIPMAALNKFFCVCSPLGIHCELSDGTSKEYHTIAALQTSSLEEALGGVTGCGASRGSGVLRLPQSTLGVEALVALSKAAARARQSSRHAAVSGLHIVSKAPEAQVCQRLGLGDVMLSQLRSTARLLASVVCPVSALELHDIPTTMTGLDAFKTFAQTTQLVTMEELALDEKVVESLVCLLQPLEDADALTVDAAGVAAAVHGVESLCAASTTALPWWKRFDDIAALSRKRPRSPQPPPLSASASLKETNVLGNVSAHSSGIAPSAEAAVAALFSCEQELNSILNMTKDSALDEGVRSLITDAMRHVGQYRKDLLSPSQSHTVTASDVAKNVRIKHEVEIHEIDDD